MLQDFPNGIEKGGSGNAKLVEMKNGKFGKDFFTVRRQLNQDLAPVTFTMAANHRAPVRQAVQELDGAVVAQAHSGRESSDGRAFGLRQPFDSEQKLMLLGFQAMSARSFFTEMKELADAITEFRELAIASQGNFNFGRGTRHIYIVTRYNCRRGLVPSASL